MAKTAMKVKQARPAKFSTREYTDVKSAAARTLIFANTVSAVYASENSLIRARFPE
jgi:hypothetical protein